jgi:Zn-dependent protease
MSSTLTLGRVARVPISVHYTWVIAFALIACSLAQGFFPHTYPGWDVGAYWLVGVVSSVALFASVLVHELSHSLLAVGRGLQVQGITLFIFGGVSHIEEDAAAPRDEFLVAIVGPLTSFALAAVFWVAVLLFPSVPLALRATLAYLATVNGFLGIFNLLPAFPLDGGRVLRSLIWGATHDLERATRIASFVGQGFAVLLVGFGAWQVLTGSILAGAWTILVAWFLSDAAQDGRRSVAARPQLDDAPADSADSPVAAPAEAREAEPRQPRRRVA